jgi:hypothetical protein
MTKKEVEFYWMVKQVQLQSARNSGAVNSYLPFKNDIIKFNNDIAALEVLMPQSLIIGTGYTIDQEEARAACSLYWDVKVCKIFKGFARKFENNIYLQKVNFTKWSINRVSIPKFYAFICQLNEVGEEVLLNSDYIDGEYAVTADVLNGGMALANSFLSIAGNADQVKGTKQQTGMAIRASIKVLREDISIMDDDVFGVSNTTFRGVYFKSRKVIKRLIHNTINLLVIDSFNLIGIKNVFAKNEGATRGDFTDIDGKKSLHKKPGTNIINLTHKDPKTGIEDYFPVQIRVKAIYKKKVNITVEMVRKNLYPEMMKVVAKKAVPAKKKVVKDIVVRKEKLVRKKSNYRK